MAKNPLYDAVIIGAGPNGLAAAIALAQAGRSVALFESKQTVGGGMRSAELTLPGFIHDLCSAIHPLGVGSPFFQSLPLDKHGLKWIQPSDPLAHPFDDGSAAVLNRSIELTGETLGVDAEAYQRFMTPLVNDWDKLADELLAPLGFPRHPLAMARFGIHAVRSSCGLTKSLFKGERARSFFAGLSAHSIMPLDQSLTAAFGLILSILGHVYGWPIPQGGSQKIADALAAYLLTLGGEIYTGVNIDSVNALPSSRAILCDLAPRQLLQIAGDRFPVGYRRKLENYRYGPGVYKIDWALSNPIPWKAKECARAGTVHLGGTEEEITASEKAVWEDKHSRNPYVIITQQSLFDRTRAPEGKHTAWGYCHVPNGSTVDMTEIIEAQVERFAPGFRDCILARRAVSTVELERYNPNYVGGNITGGIWDFSRFFHMMGAFKPYSTPVKGLYLCSAYTPPGGGVHGMCGYHAAQAALKDVLK